MLSSLLFEEKFVKKERYPFDRSRILYLQSEEGNWYHPQNQTLLEEKKWVIFRIDGVLVDRDGTQKKVDLEKFDLHDLEEGDILYIGGFVKGNKWRKVLTFRIKRIVRNLTAAMNEFLI